MSRTTTKAKRACIDCHFLAIVNLEWDFQVNPPVANCTDIHYEASLSKREQIRQKEAITFPHHPVVEMEFDGSDFELGCHKGVWCGLYLRDHEDRYTTVVKTGRSKCIYFYPYKPSMDFDVADQFRVKEGLSQSNENKSISNKIVVGAGQIDKKDITPDTLFMDDTDNVLYLDKNILVALTREEIKLIDYMGKQNAFKLEQILNEHFNINCEQSCIPREERALFDTYKSNINKKCKSLGIEGLIIKGGIKKAFKLSVKITKKTFKF